MVKSGMRPSDEPHHTDDANTLPAGSARRDVERLGRFPVSGRLGAGGMGEVLAVRDEALGRQVAAKVIRGRADASAVERFLLEAQLTGRLEHPNIVPVYELGASADGQRFFTMKQVQGQDLASILKAQRDGTEAPRSRIELLQVFGKICDAIGFAHSRGIIHRDLKPANVMVGAFGEVLVMDWGLAKVLAAPASEATDSGRLPAPDARPEGRASAAAIHAPTLDGEIKGTPAYMPPEQARGEIARLDARSDIYSLGAILYQMLTLRPPHEGGSLMELICRVGDGVPVIKPSERAPERAIPFELDAVVLRAMAPDATERYPDVGSLSADVTRYLEGGLLDAARYTIWQRTRKWLRRNRTAALIGLAVVLATLGQLALTSARRATARRSALREGRAEARRLIDAAPRLAALELMQAERRDAERRAGGERPEALHARDARESALQAYLSAAQLLDRLLALAPDDPQLRAQRREVGRGLGHVALLGGDYSLARQAFGGLAEHGAPPAEVQALVERVRQAGQRRVARRVERIAAILADIDAGLQRPERPRGSPTIDDMLFEVAGYRDLEVVQRLQAALTPLIDRARAAADAVEWRQPERDRALFVCGALGRLGLVEAVAPLAAWMALVRDTDLAVAAGRALCNTRRREAYEPLRLARIRLGSGSQAWSRIKVYFDRVPEPAGPEDLSAAALVRRGQARLAQGESRGALQDAVAAIARDPERTAAYLLSAGALHKLGRLAEGLAAVAKGLQRSPRSPELHNLAGVFHTELGDLPAALVAIDRAIVLSPRYAAAFHNRGQAQQLAGRADRAVDDLSRALQIDPRRVESLTLRAHVYLRAGDPTRAESDASGALGLDPERVAALVTRGLARAAMGRLTEAEADFERAIRLAPRSVDALCGRARTRLRRKKAAAALADLDAALRLKPRYAEAHDQRGWALRQLGRMDEALRAHSRAIELSPRFLTAYIARADVYRLLDRRAAARQDLERAVQLAPRSVRQWEMRAVLRRKLGDAAGSVADLDRALALAPRQASLFHQRAIVRSLMKQHESALADYDRALALRPDDALLRVDRATARRRAGDLDGAQADLDRALELDPRSGPAHLARGLLWQARGDLRKAAVDYAMATRLDPDDWRSWANHGQALGRLGERRRAVEVLREALRRAPAKVRPRLKAEIARFGG